jgi:hypothetical protein
MLFPNLGYTVRTWWLQNGQDAAFAETCTYRINYCICHIHTTRPDTNRLGDSSAANYDSDPDSYRVTNHSAI